MGGYAPRARRHGTRPQRLIGASGRRLAFDVGCHDQSRARACSPVRRPSTAGDARSNVPRTFILEVRASTGRGSYVVVRLVEERLPLVRAVVRDLRGVCWSTSLDSRHLHALGQSVCATSDGWRVTFLAGSKGLLLHGGWRRASPGVVCHAPCSGYVGGRAVGCRLMGPLPGKIAS